MYPYALFVIEKGKNYGIRRYNLVKKEWETIKIGLESEEDAKKEVHKLNDEAGMFLVTIE